MATQDLTKAQWAKPEPLLPAARKRPGRPPVHTKRQPIDGIRRRTRAGAPWRAMSERHGPWETVYGLFRRWQRDGTWHRVFEQLQALTGTPPTTRSSSTPTPGSSSWSADRCPGTAMTARTWEESGAKAAVGRHSQSPTAAIREDLPDWKEAHNKSHKQVRARVEHVFAE